MIYAPNQVGRVLPADYGPYRNEIQRGSNCDPAPEDTNFWVTTVVGRDPGYTTNRGVTWTTCPALRIAQGWTGPEIAAGQGGGGCLTVLSKDVWIIGSLTGPPYNSTTRAKNTLYITRDRGVSFTELLVGNGNAINTFMAAFSGVARKVLIKDRYYTAAGLLGRVYFYNAGDTDNTGNADNLACKGLWQIDVPTANTAPTVTRKNSNRLTSGNQDIIHNKLVVLGAAGKLGFCGGDGCPFTFYSADGGANWTEITGTDDVGAGTKFTQVYGIAAGKARFDSAFPTIYVAGYRDTANAAIVRNGAGLAKYGLWASYDDRATWTKIAVFPGGSPIQVADLDASMATYGEVTVTLGGLGAATLYYDYRLRAT